MKPPAVGFFCFVSDPKDTIHTDIHHATNSGDPKEVPKFLLVGSGVQSSGPFVPKCHLVY